MGQSVYSEPVTVDGADQQEKESVEITESVEGVVQQEVENVEPEQNNE